MQLWKMGNFGWLYLIEDYIIPFDADSDNIKRIPKWIDRNISINQMTPSQFEEEINDTIEDYIGKDNLSWLDANEGKEYLIGFLVKNRDFHHKQIYSIGRLFRKSDIIGCVGKASFISDPSNKLMGDIKFSMTSSEIVKYLSTQIECPGNLSMLFHVYKQLKLYKIYGRKSNQS